MRHWTKKVCESFPVLKPLISSLASIVVLFSMVVLLGRLIGIWFSGNISLFSLWRRTNALKIFYVFWKEVLMNIVFLRFFGISGSFVERWFSQLFNNVLLPQIFCVRQDPFPLVCVIIWTFVRRELPSYKKVSHRSFQHSFNLHFLTWLVSSYSATKTPWKWI